MRVASIGLILYAAAAGAQSARPVIAPPGPFAPPLVTARSLPNGLRVALVPHGVTPTARVELVIQTGRAYEDADEIGAAQLVGDYVLEGTAARNGTALARQLSELGTVGGGLAVVVGSHETSIAGEVLAESAPRLVELIGEIVRAPAFDSAALERLTSSLRRRAQSQATTAATLASTRVNEVLFPADPADRAATDAQLNRLTIGDLRRFHTTHYVAARARLYVAGVFDQSEVESAVSTAFGSMQPGRGVAPLRTTDFRSMAGDGLPVVHLIDRPNATQSRLHIAFPIVDQMHPDHLTLNVLNAVMGSVQTSRIIANVRERHGYSYNVSSRLIRRPGATTLAVQADVNRDVTGAALREILSELQQIETRPPSGEELSGFHRFMSGIMMLEMSTARGIIEYLRSRNLYGDDARSYLANLVPSVHGVTSAELLRVNRTYLRPDRRVIVIVGDARSVEPQLADIARVVK